jgi:serine/threonine protein kinase
MKALVPNTMIQNRYLIVQSIGKGGMGEVYLAVDQRLGSAVALKRTFFSDDSTLGSAFEREARILARLRHPVLPKVIDHFAENGDQFLVMEHISGDDLSKRLETANKPFPLKWVMFWADQLLDALSYLHSHEPPIIHRDIKPQNLKLTDENHIVLLDFGLSKDFDTSAANSLNSASVAGYSPHFAAMEQIRGTGTDGRSDLYSLSATLYQLMTNVVPVDALSRADALLGGKKDPIVPLNEINPEIPEVVSNVILKGISIRQDERFNTASEMQRSLRRAYNHGNIPPADPAVPSVEPAKAAGAQAAADTFRSKPEPTAPVVAAEPKQAFIETAIMSADDMKEAGLSKETDDGTAPKTKKAAAGAQGPAGAVRQNEKVEHQQAAHSPAEPKAGKKRSGMGIAVAGMIGFVLISAVVAGGGWYAYKNYYAAAAPSPSPDASPAISSSPEAVSVADTEIETQSPLAEPTGGSNAADLTKVQETSPVNATKQPATQTSKNAAPGRPQKTPAAKATPKPKGGERTVILQ